MIYFICLERLPHCSLQSGVETSELTERFIDEFNKVGRVFSVGRLREWGAHTAPPQCLLLASPNHGNHAWHHASPKDVHTYILTQDMAALNVLPPALEPRATAFVPQMISTITDIIANGHAYAVDGGDVFFDVASLPGYGRLSGRQQEDNRCAGAGVAGGGGEGVDRGRGCFGWRTWWVAVAAAPHCQGLGVQ